MDKQLVIGLLITVLLVLTSCSSEPTGMAVFQDIQPFTSVQDIEDGLTILYEKAIVLNLKESNDDYDLYVGEGFEVYELNKPVPINTFARARIMESNNRLRAASAPLGLQSDYDDKTTEYTWGVESWFLLVFVDDQMLVQHATENNNLYMPCGERFIINVKPTILDNPDLYWKDYGKSVVFPAFEEEFSNEKAQVMYYMRRLQQKC